MFSGHKVILWWSKLTWLSGRGKHTLSPSVKRAASVIEVRLFTDFLQDLFVKQFTCFQLSGTKYQSGVTAPLVMTSQHVTGHKIGWELNLS